MIGLAWAGWMVLEPDTFRARLSSDHQLRPGMLPLLAAVRWLAAGLGGAAAGLLLWSVVWSRQARTSLRALGRSPRAIGWILTLIFGGVYLTLTGVAILRVCQ